MSRDKLPPLRLVTVFDAVLRCGSLQRAAAELNVTQPAVSQAVRQLEDYIGAKLLNRDTRPASLTEAGLILQRGVSCGLGEIGGAIAEVQATQAAAENSLTVACTVGTATYWLMPCLTGFHERHPHLAVSVRTVAAGPPRVVPGVDVAIRYGLGDWGEGPTRRLHRDKGVPVCSPDLFAALSEHGFDLNRTSLLHVDSGERNWMGWPEYLERAAIPKPSRPGRLFTNYVQATQAALAGQGVMLGWNSMVRDLVRDGKLRELPLPHIIPKEAFFLVFPERPRRGKAIDAFVEWLTEAATAVELEVCAAEQIQPPASASKRE